MGILNPANKMENEDYRIVEGNQTMNLVYGMVLNDVW